MRSTNSRTVASVVSVSDKSKSLKLKSRRWSDWADGMVANFKHTQNIYMKTAGKTTGFKFKNSALFS